MRQRVEQRTMPPWAIDARIGSAVKFKDDPSLSASQIATISQWVAAGAPQGDPTDMPAPRTFPPVNEWQIGNGKPDLVVAQGQDFKMYAQGNDTWIDYVMDPHLTEDVWIKELQLKPGNRRIVHHVVVWGVNDKPDPGAVDSGGGEGGSFLAGMQQLYTFVPNRTPAVYPKNAGLLLRAGTKIRFSMHYAASGKEENDRTQLGLVFYPKSDPPEKRLQATYLSVDQEKIDIAPNSISRMSGYYRLEKPTLLASWTPHMHQRGRAQTLEAIYPNGRVETLTRVENYDFGWQITYQYADDIAPLLPAGTMLHVDITYDNTSANRTNPDPDRWVGYGAASTDEMGGAFIDFVQLSQAEFDKAVSDRKAKQSTSTNARPSTGASR